MEKHLIDKPHLFQVAMTNVRMKKLKNKFKEAEKSFVNLFNAMPDKIFSDKQ